MLQEISYPERGCIGHRPNAATGMWVVDTSSPNYWWTALKRVLCKSAADVILTQETKVRSTALASATKKAFQLIWKTVFGDAKITSALVTSGGTAVSARKGLGILQHPPPADGFEHRIAGHGSER